MSRWPTPTRPLPLPFWMSAPIPPAPERYSDDIERAANRLASIAGRPVLSEEGRRSVATILQSLPSTPDGWRRLASTPDWSTRLERPTCDERPTRCGTRCCRPPRRCTRKRPVSSTRPTSADVADRYLGCPHRRGGRRRPARVRASPRVRADGRLLNAGLLGATAIVVALGAWAGLTLHSQQASLLRSQREGSDQLIVLSTARILALQSLSAENLHLIELATEPHLEHFEEATGSIGAPDGSTGLLGAAAGLAGGQARPRAVDEIAQRYADYLAVHEAVPELDDAASYRQGGGAGGDRRGRRSRAARRGPDKRDRSGGSASTANAADAHGSFRGLAAVVAASALLAAVLAVVGLQRRIREYR